MMNTLLTHLESCIPGGWSFVPVNGRKSPVNPTTGKGLSGWQNTAYKLADLNKESEHVKAIGVLTGPASNGLLCIDIDSDQGRCLLEDITERELVDFPRTIACTSGKHGTQKLFYQVSDESVWPLLRTTHLVELDILWKGCQAVLCGEHPETGSYQWLAGCSPSEVALADAPQWLIDALVDHTKDKQVKSGAGFTNNGGTHQLKKQRKLPYELKSTNQNDRNVALQALRKLNPADHENYQSWLKVGMCLHSVDESLLDDWIDWSSYMSNFDEEECHVKWATFSDLNSYLEKSGRQGLGLGTLISMSATGRAESVGDEELKSLLQNREKCNLALLNYLRSKPIRFNELKRRVEFDGEIMKQDPRYFYLQLAEELGININRELARDALLTVANENPYNPVADYLQSVLALAEETESVSDEEIAKWFGYEFGDNVSIGLTRVHLRACVVRGMTPGSKMDSVLILAGRMGLRKSSAIKSLVPDESWYDETTQIDIDNKDTQSSMNSSWIFEFSEIEKLTATKDSAPVKAWVTRTSDKYVEKYETVQTEHPRRCCLWGSTNSSAFLNDPTGSRRYWITEVRFPCDTDAIQVNRDRLWAHTLREVLEGKPYYLDTSDPLMIEAATRGSNATITDPWQEKLERMLAHYKPGHFLSTQNLFALIDIGAIYMHKSQNEVETLQSHNHLDARRLANAMNALGWRSHRTSSARGYLKL